MLESGGKLDRRQAREVLSLFAQESKARTGTFLSGKLISDHGLFSSYEGQQNAANRQDLCSVFQEYAHGVGRLDGGSRAGFTSSRSPPPWTSVFKFPHFCIACGLEKPWLVDQN